MRRGDIAAVLAVGLSLIDGLMTLPYWHLEGNPFVLELGPAGMMGLKIVVGAALLLTWFRWVGRGRHRQTVAWLLWALAGLYAVVVVTNVAVIMS